MTGAGSRIGILSHQKATPQTTGINEVDGDMRPPRQLDRPVVIGHAGRLDEAFRIDDQRLAAAEAGERLYRVGQSPEALADASLGQLVSLVRHQGGGRRERRSGTASCRRVAAGVLGGPHRIVVRHRVLEGVPNEPALEALDGDEELAVLERRARRPSEVRQRRHDGHDVPVAQLALEERHELRLRLIRGGHAQVDVVEEDQEVAVLLRRPDDGLADTVRGRFRRDGFRRDAHDDGLEAHDLMRPAVLRHFEIGGAEPRDRSTVVEYDHVDADQLDACRKRGWSLGNTRRETGEGEGGDHDRRWPEHD